MNFRGLVLGLFIGPILVVAATPAATTHKRSPLPLVAASSVIIPIHLENDSVSIRIDRVEKAQQRRSFFRIGMLPTAKLTGVEIDLSSTRRDPAVLTQVESTLHKALRSQAVELVNVTIKLSHDLSLATRKLEFQKQGALSLRGATLQHGSNTIHALTATLHLTGEHAGWLHLNSDPQPQQFQLFSAPSQ